MCVYVYIILFALGKTWEDGSCLTIHVFPTRSFCAEIHTGFFGYAATEATGTLVESVI